MPSLGNVTSVLEQVLHNDTRSTSLPPYEGALLALTLSQQHGSDEARNGSVSSPAAHSSFVGNLDAFFYIIVVLSFYAISLVLLMIKYIRREQEETSWTITTRSTSNERGSNVLTCRTGWQWRDRGSYSKK
ncbi:hypothetical protein C0Q70_16301 [Pomacea canaliculata]|uniref:Uncharacterized protein n=1 Tax=Pomacea canaliculata TaxID=400727 RepID=A0A2T7NPD9_POMCA|nr:hypothetical protein C0Q70_16301 [Pomacea canaliculata]